MSETKHTPTPWTLAYKVSYPHTNRILAPKDCADGPVKIADLFSSASYDADINGAFIVRACNSHAALIEALRTVSLLGGNLRDEVLEERTGPNDARQRGIMYTTARKVALEALRAAGEEAP